MASPAPRDKFVTTSTLVIVTLLLAMAGAIALYWNGTRHRAPEADSAYATVGPLTVGTQAYSVRAQLAVQTRRDDAQWARQHQSELARVVEGALSTLDPQQVHRPDGLASLERSLRATLNLALHTDKIERIWLTDFLLQTDV